jgi:hypothetical protein
MITFIFAVSSANFVTDTILRARNLSGNKMALNPHSQN